MAVPFHLPTDEETEDVFRRIDQIILDLYEILRQLLRRQTAQVADLRVRALTGEVVNPTVSPSAEETASTVSQPLSDLSPSTAQLTAAPSLSIKKVAPNPPPRRTRRRRHSNKTVNHTTAMALVVFQLQPQESLLRQRILCRSWLNFGFELNQVAEESTVTTQRFGVIKKKQWHEMKVSSLFSMLQPSSMTGAICTTVIILVGWRIFVAKQK